MNEEESAILRTRLEMHDLLLRTVFTIMVPPDGFKAFMAGAMKNLQTPRPQETEQAKLERERSANCLHAFGVSVLAEMESQIAQAEKMNQPAGSIQ